MTETEQNPIEIIYDEAPLRMGYVQGQTNELVVCFSSVGQTRAEMPLFEFINTATGSGRHGLFIADIGRSWMNGTQQAEIVTEQVQKIVEAHGITSVTTMGLSMGGFNALIAPRLFKVDRVIAFSPQYSVHPKHIPNEGRWAFWRRKLDVWRYETVEPIPSDPQIFLFHGLVDDAAHARAFPVQDNIDHFFFPAFDHTGLTTRLREKGLLSRMVEHALAGRRAGVARLTKRMGGNFRSRFNDDPVI
ncbi:MAG: pimeloyl-ACP methyl ester carboxylesterase [Halocynthiibacter sp.]|jgi:pimeloyl-ACP methyl ester carboxylesterase